MGASTVRTRTLLHLRHAGAVHVQKRQAEEEQHAAVPRDQLAPELVLLPQPTEEVDRHDRRDRHDEIWPAPQCTEHPTRAEALRRKLVDRAFVVFAAMDGRAEEDVGVTIDHAAIA